MGNLLRKQKASWSVFNRDSLISIQGREILLLVVKTGAVLGVLNYFFIGNGGLLCCLFLLVFCISGWNVEI